MAATTRCLGSMDRSNRSENHVIFWLHPFHLYSLPLVHESPSSQLSRDFFGHHRPINSVILLSYVVTEWVKKKKKLGRKRRVFLWLIIQATRRCKEYAQVDGELLPLCDLCFSAVARKVFFFFFFSLLSFLKRSSFIPIAPVF